jgi:hypothetical protein
MRAVSNRIGRGHSMSARGALLGISECALLCASACRSAAAPFPSAQPASPGPPGVDIFNLRLTKATLRANGASDALLDKIGASAFRYFRAMAEPFKHRTCEAEQAVTAYFTAYRTALDHPVSRRQPAIVARLRARLGPEPEAWLQWAESLMQPLAHAEEERVRREWFRFVALMRETTPARPESFYRIHRLGSIEIGLGSALERKLLIRIAGATDDSRDDVILEARSHSLPEYRGCVWRPTGGSLNVFMLTSMLGHRLPNVFGILPNPDGDELPEIWIQSWERGYRELSLSDVRGQADLDALAADAGTQLAGHFWSTSPEALRGHQRFTQLRALELTERRARELARSLARDAVAEWSRFRGQERP